MAEGAVSTAEVAAAVRVVPRHVFTPGLALERAYANQVVFVKRDEFGVPTSSVSAPDIQAIMLEQAEIRPGMRLLEIGSGGYNAALMAELAGPDGEVTTIDIDPVVTERARRCLDEAGYADVRVVTADAEGGVPEGAPYDRIVVTVEAWDLPPAWIRQLTPHGRIVVPLLLRGMTRSIAFDRVDDHLVSRSARLCGFVKMQGAGSRPDQGLALNHGDLTIDTDDSGAIPTAAQIEAHLRHAPRAERWSGVRVWRWEPWDTLPLWLATDFPGYCQLSVNVPGAPAVPGPPGAPGTEPLEPALAIATPAIATPDGFAHLTARACPDGRIELGAHAFGPQGPQLAAAVADSIAAWNRDQRAGSGPVITAWPIDAPLPDAADVLAVKKHVQLTVTWSKPEIPHRSQPNG
ncbi:protein-L-isoaspartate(D-aspartate)O-methyltransferase [Catenulispora acidiphila DSM 44928]|uniref:Protein-L-isoaspartate O-methyltransferase n=1 Tax=Catenulispora acidiphila (strain DSM 44928 / JCM 14897 / NBRC 102108 / NRRL B-24433 / ID139908) TaxID=479433 RepID=C7Q6N4_CATAD|nr:protein-L-isoaspartate(D-aspartate)O-methyltransferase [Catenulispora acidiphila DSM 44928]